MSSYFYMWVSFCMLSPILLAEGIAECSEKETLLQPIVGTVAQITDCLMECTGMTFIKKLQLQDKHNIRLKDSTEGDLGEYCWSTELKCTVGESFHSAYVVLPVDISTVRHEQLQVRAMASPAPTAPTASTAPTATSTTVLQGHTSPITVAESCGLRYDVTQHFRTQQTGTSFCVQVVAQGDILGDKVLKCPPFLVTFWQRNTNRSNQEGGG